MKSLRILGLLLALSGLSACANVSPAEQARRAFDSVDLAAAESSYVSGDHAKAVATWQSGLSMIPRDKPAYFESGLFYDQYYLESALAWHELNTGDAEAAKREFERIFRDLGQAERSYESYRRGIDRRASQMNLFGNFLTTAAVLYGYRVGQDLSYLYKTPIYADQPLVNSREMIPNRELLGDWTRSGDGVRITMLPAVGELKKIGRLRNADGSSCTASLVGEALALTNGHCVTDSNGRGRTTRNMFVEFNGLGSQDRVRVSNYETAYVDRDWGADWALLYLERHPAGRGFLGYLPDMTDAPAGTQIVLAGFSGDINDGRFITMDWGCSIVGHGRDAGRSDGVLMHSCQMYKGASGTPLLAIAPGERRFYIVGLNAFGYSDVTHGGGGPTVDQFADAITNARATWPSAQLASQ